MNWMIEYFNLEDVYIAFGFLDRLEWFFFKRGVWCVTVVMGETFDGTRGRLSLRPLQRRFTYRYWGFGFGSGKGMLGGGNGGSKLFFFDNPRSIPLNYICILN